MATNTKDVACDFSPFFRLFTDRTIDRFHPPQHLPPSNDPTALVRSKDVIIDPETNVSVRIYLPQNPQTNKLPVVLYIHGGAFCVGSASSPVFHNFVSTLVEKVNVIAVSVDYRLAPEFPLENTYEDTWSAFRWVADHALGKRSDHWLNRYADFKRVYLGGESAGANIANYVAIRAGTEARELGVEVVGTYLMHPFFGGKEEDKLYKFLCPSSSGRDDDPKLNPAAHERIGEMAGRRVMFVTGEKDMLRDRARAYYNRLKMSAWKGEVEWFETEGEGHCFYLFDLKSEKAVVVMDWLVDFLKRE